MGKVKSVRMVVARRTACAIQMIPENKKVFASYKIVDTSVLSLKKVDDARCDH